jgi:hypothetical protein
VVCGGVALVVRDLMNLFRLTAVGSSARMTNGTINLGKEKRLSYLQYLNNIMTETELTIAVRLSCQRALLGAITPGIRLITLKWNKLEDFYFRAYYDTMPSDQDIDEMEAVIAEIESDIAFKTDHGAECIYDIRPRNQLSIYDWVVYARKE